MRGEWALHNALVGEPLRKKKPLLYQKKSIALRISRHEVRISEHEPEESQTAKTSKRVIKPQRQARGLSSHEGENQKVKSLRGISKREARIVLELSSVSWHSHSVLENPRSPALAT